MVVIYYLSLGIWINRSELIVRVTMLRVLESYLR